MMAIENMDIPTIDAVPIVGLSLLLHEELLPNNWDSLCKQVIVYNHTYRQKKKAWLFGIEITTMKYQIKMTI